MFNHPYAAELLAEQHRRDLQAGADRARLARQATLKQTLRHDPSAHRRNVKAHPWQRWQRWLSSHLRRTATSHHWPAEATADSHQ